MPDTKEWAESHGVCITDSVPPVDDYNESYKRTAADVASRTIILHCVAAVGYGVDPQPVLEWLEDESLWDVVSPNERAFICSDNPDENACNDARWRQEAQWALLWAIGKVESLGLPTKTCDTGMLVDQIMPGLGEPTEAFISSAELRTPAVLLAEDERVYNLHCYARQAFRENTMPEDLVYGVLFQRHYAFEWLGGKGDWDDVRTDT